MVAITIGIVLDFIIGDPHNPLHPVRIIGSYAKIVEEVTRKIFKKNLKVAGGIAWFIIVLSTLLVGISLIKLATLANPILGTIIEGIIIYFCISAKGLKVEGLKVIKSLKNIGLEEARHKLSYIVGRDTKNLNQESIIKAVVETVAENMSDGIIAPLFFATIGGGAFALMYKAVNTCDSMFGYKNDKYIDFGFVSAKLDDLFNYIPARITGYLIIIASFILGLNYKNSFKVYKRDRYNHTSPNSAHPEAAVAGSLEIQLGGSNYYFGKLVEKPTIGDAIKCIEVDDVYKTNKILVTSTILGFVLAITVRFIGGIILWIMDMVAI